MPSISPISAASTPSPIQPASRIPRQVLGQEDFLKLLATQFQVQDPMNPMEDTAFIAQMAQFSSLEQSQTLTQQMTQLRANQDLVTANSYLGRRLTMDAGTGTTVEGDVTGVDLSGATPQLIINDRSFPLSAVRFVAPGLVNPPVPAPTAPVGSPS
jgi:flagellar basal-body rod modification protein FlgD